MAALRRAKQDVALTLGLADLAGAIELETVTRAPHRFRRRGACRRAPLRACRGEARGPVDRRRRRRRASSSSAWGNTARGELNYSSDIDIIALFDPRGARPRGPERAVGLLGEDHTPARDAAAGAHRRRLCLPHRPAAPARSRRDARRALLRGGASLLREHGTELGARRADQGARRRRRHRGRREVHPRARAVHLAQIPRLRGDRRHPLHQAAGARASRSRDRPRARPRHQARARRHPRDRVLRADTAADRRRTRPGAARHAHARDAAKARREGVDRRGGASGSSIDAYRMLRNVEHRLQMVRDEQTHTMPVGQRRSSRGSPG